MNIAFYKTGKKNNQTFMNLEIISKKIITNLAQYWQRRDTGSHALSSQLSAGL